MSICVFSSETSQKQYISVLVGFIVKRQMLSVPITYEKYGRKENGQKAQGFKYV